MVKLKDLIGAETLESSEEITPDCNLIAALAEGKLGGEERRRALAHVSSNAESNRIFMATVSELQRGEQQSAIRADETRFGHWNRYAIAASLALCLMVGSGIYLGGFGGSHSPDSTATVAANTAATSTVVGTLPMDAELEQYLTSGKRQWSGDQARQIADLLISRGITLAAADTRQVTLTTSPYLSKGISNNRRELLVKVKNGVVEIEVRPVEGAELLFFDSEQKK